MSLDAKVSALTASLKKEFWLAWHQVATPADWQLVTTELPSTTKIENYINATPVPGFVRWTGQRNYAQPTTNVFQVRNETWHDEIACKLEDIEDDQTGFLLQQPKFLVEKGKQFPGRLVLKLLGQALGSTIALTGGLVGNILSLVDSQTFFTNRIAGGPGFGTGNNLVSYTAASGDGKTYNMAALYYGSPVLKPLCWQLRSGPEFETNSGQPQSKENRQVRWWCDLRGAPFLSYWFNTVGVQITNTPTVAEMHAIFSAVIAAFRTYAFPKTASTEDGEYVHEQTKFSAENLCYVVSTYLSEQMDQALGEQWIPQNIGGNTVATTNKWAGKARYIQTRFMDNF